jgi:OTU domain-containing protein 5
VLLDTMLTRSMQLLLAMGFTCNQVMEPYDIFSKDVDCPVWALSSFENQLEDLEFP